MHNGNVQSRSGSALGKIMILAGTLLLIIGVAVFLVLIVINTSAVTTSPPSQGGVVVTVAPQGNANEFVNDSMIMSLMMMGDECWNLPTYAETGQSLGYSVVDEGLMVRMPDNVIVIVPISDIVITGIC